MDAQRTCRASGRKGRNTEAPDRAGLAAARLRKRIQSVAMGAHVRGQSTQEKVGRFPAVSLSEAQVLATELNDAFEHRQVSPLKPA